MVKKLADLLFLGAIIILLTAGLARALLFPKEINTYENRYANQMPALTVESYLDGSFQQGVDDALSDQVYLSGTYKKTYNRVKTDSLRLLLSPLVQRYPNRYFSFQGQMLFDGCLTYGTSRMSTLAHDLDLRAENYNETFARLPGVTFYFYYVRKDTDINFETGEIVPAFEYFRDQLDLPADHTDCLDVNSFADFSRFFYHTDHHWNHRGSYQGYLDLLALLGIGDEPLAPLEEVSVPGEFAGSKVSVAGAEGIWESISMYRFAFPDMAVTVNGSPAGDYGAQEAFWFGQGGKPTYGNIYGGDMGELILSGGKEGGGSILVIGESYDNALLKLLASHYETLYSVDLRYYEHSMGKPFRLSEYVAEHDIHQTLLIGNIDFLLGETFSLEG